MTAQLPSKVRLAQIASFTKSMTLPPSHDEIEAMAHALLAAHEQEPVRHVIQQLRGYENPTYVVQMANEPEDGDEVFSHPAPVHAVPEGYVLVPLKPTKDMLTAAEYDRGADWQYSVDI